MIDLVSIKFINMREQDACKTKLSIYFSLSIICTFFFLDILANYMCVIDYRTTINYISDRNN